jgi:hypothetical protein
VASSTVALRTTGSESHIGICQSSVARHDQAVFCGLSLVLDAHNVRASRFAFPHSLGQPASYQGDSSAAPLIASGVARRPVTSSMLIR